MNKSELISEISAASGLTKADSEKALEAFVSTVEKTLKSGEEIRLVGFGTFCVATRKATIARNPRTGDEISVPERNVPKFKPGKQLKDLIEG